MQRYAAIITAMLAGLALMTGCGSDDEEASDQGTTAAAETAAEETTAEETGGSALDQTLAWIERVEAGEVKPEEQLKIAWLKSDAKNPYTVSERQGGLDAADMYGAEVKVFDASFNPNTQAQQLQDALTQYDAGQFDGILVEPVAGEVLCNRVKVALAKDVPVGVDNQPLCGDDGYTEGTTGYAGMQLQRYFDAHVENAFKSCDKPCKAAVLTGPVGFDVVTKLQAAVEKMQAKYPDVDVVANQPTDFSAQSAYGVMRDALTANPDIEMVVSQWDDMMVGVDRAVTQAGKQPGTDVRIYSNGADKTGVKLIADGQMTESTVLMPYEEANYAMHQLFRFLIEDVKTEGTVWLGDSPPVVDGPGLFITESNVSEWEPEY